MKVPHHNLALTASVFLGAVVYSSGSAEEVLTVSRPGLAPKIDRSFSRQPLAFERNVGQVDWEVQYLARGPGYQLFLTGTEAVMVLNSPAPGAIPKAPEDWRSPSANGDATVPKESPAPAHVLRMRLVGANLSPSVRGDTELRGKVNYFIGNAPSLWRTNISTFAKLRYREVYPGTDLVYYGNEGGLEYDFVLAPGADPNQIAMEIDGAHQIELDTKGDLIAWVAGRPVRWQKPVVYQEFDGQRIEIAGDYRLNGGSLTCQADNSHQIGFELSAYDRSEPLVIDPVLVYSTYLGGVQGGEGATGVAADAEGNAFVVGYTYSPDFPVKNALQPTLAGSADVFVSKLSGSGELIFSTFLGGTGDDGSPSVAVDELGNCYVAGNTASTNFPSVRPIQTAPRGKGDVFITELDQSGSAILFSTYFGGSEFDYAGAVAVDPSGYVYVAGETGSTNFPIKNALQPEHGPSRDGFVAKLSPQGSAIVYSTFYGGDGPEGITKVAADADGNAYIAGYTFSSDLPTVNAFQPFNYGGGWADFFFAKVNPTGSDLVFASYFGGADIELPPVVMALGQGELVVGGATTSQGLATPGAFQPERSNCRDIIVSVFDAATGAQRAATFLPGSGAGGLAVDAEGNICVAGITWASGCPFSPVIPPEEGPIQASVASQLDFQVAKLSADCSTMLFRTYLGGSQNDGTGGSGALALDSEGNLLVIGGTSSAEFPLKNPIQSTLAGGGDAVIFKISMGEELRVSRSGQTLTLSWPVGAINYVLEATTSLSAVSWVAVTNTPTLTATNRSVQLPIAGAAKFFRLRKP